MRATWRRTNLGWMVDAKTTTLDHRWPAHANRRILRRNDDVAATEHCSVAGKAIAGHHAHHRHQAGQLCELHE